MVNKQLLDREGEDNPFTLRPTRKHSHRRVCREDILRFGDLFFFFFFGGGGGVKYIVFQLWPTFDIWWIYFATTFKTVRVPFFQA